jgi:hypothetical protein
MRDDFWVTLLASSSLWSSYDRSWFSGPDQQEIFIFIQKSGFYAMYLTTVNGFSFLT